jgi:ferric iron reductase protein FhuF
MNLWDWFVADVFHVSSISFLSMLGIVWFVQLLTEHPSRDAEFLWKKAYGLIDFCIPEEKREAVEDLLEQINSEMWEELWVGAGQQAFGATLTLVFGFCVHVFA